MLKILRSVSYSFTVDFAPAFRLHLLFLSCFPIIVSLFPRSVYCCFLKISVVHSTETSLNVYRTTRCHIPKDSNIQIIPSLYIFTLRNVCSPVVELALLFSIYPTISICWIRRTSLEINGRMFHLTGFAVILKYYTRTLFVAISRDFLPFICLEHTKTFSPCAVDGFRPISFSPYLGYYISSFIFLYY
jgi:hypothetical protein